MKIFWMILILTFTHVSFAQEEAPVETEVIEKTRQWQFGPRLMLWQEQIPASDATGDLDYRARFTAVAIGVTHKRSFGTHKWMQSHGADLIFGSARASGVSAGTADLTNTQNFYAAQISPGLSYRTTPSTLIGFSTPLFYRHLNWKLTRPGVDLGDESKLSLGLGLNAVWILEKGSMVTTSFTYRDEAVMWTLAYDFSL